MRYITRPEARADLLAQRMPTERHAARRWLNREERQDRQNARIIDKITAALPRELDARQRRMLVAVFAEWVTRGRASWLAAIHQSGEDAHNPHAHIVIRDRDPETGKRVTRLSHAARGIETSPQRHRDPREASRRAGEGKRGGYFRPDLYGRPCV